MCKKVFFSCHFTGPWCVSQACPHASGWTVIFWICSTCYPELIHTESRKAF